jgi:uncharacterized protein
MPYQTEGADMQAEQYDVIIIGTGPAALGAAFQLTEILPSLSILMIDKETVCSGGLLNDCKQNYTFPIGFAEEYWSRDDAERLLPLVEEKLQPDFKERRNLDTYHRRAARVGATLYDIRQAHVGTDRSKLLIKRLMDELVARGVKVLLEHEVTDVREGKESAEVVIGGGECFKAGSVVIAPGRKGFGFLQRIMEQLGIAYIDNIVDIGIRVETRLENYPIVKDYYDPKFYFPERVRTFCTNSGHARVVQERYEDFNLVNGFAMSEEKSGNDLVNFAMLKTIGLKAPVRSGQQMAVFLGSCRGSVISGWASVPRLKHSTMTSIHSALPAM